MAGGFDDWEGQYLCHYGVKGMKWGQRRYQNKDGSLTELGKYRARAIRTAKTKRDVDSIYKSLSKKDRVYLTGSRRPSKKEYLSLDEGEKVIKRFIKKDKNKPVAFLDIIEGGSKYRGYENDIVVATRSGSKYRNKGYATELGKKATAWIDKHPEKLQDKVKWIADPDNAPSNKLAEKLGFEYSEEETGNYHNKHYKYKKRG